MSKKTLYFTSLADTRQIIKRAREFSGGAGAVEAVTNGFMPRAEIAENVFMAGIECFSSPQEGCVWNSESAANILNEIKKSELFRNLDGRFQYKLAEIFEVRFLFNFLLVLPEKMNMASRAVKFIKPDKIFVDADNLFAVSICNIGRSLGIDSEILLLEHGKGGIFVKKPLYINKRKYIIPIPRVFDKTFKLFNFLRLIIKGKLHGILGGSARAGADAAILSLDHRYADIVSAVAGALKKAGLNSFSVIDRRFCGSSKLKKAGLRFESFEAGFTRNVYKAYSKDKKILDGIIKSSVNEGVFNFNGINFFDDFLRYLKGITESLYEAVLVYYTACEHINKKHVKALVLTDDKSPFQRSVIEAARSRNVKTVCIQSAIATRLKQGEPIYADYILCDGEAPKRILLEHGVPDGRLVVTGQPRFDGILQKLENINREILLKELGISSGKKVVVFFSQHLNLYLKKKDMASMYGALIGAVSELNDVCLVTKLHPIETSKDIYEKIIAEKKYRGNKFVLHLDIWDLLCIADLAVTYSSTSGYEAIVAGKDLVQLDLTDNKKEIIDYTAFGAALGAFQKEGLIDIIKQALFDGRVKEALRQGRRKYIENYACGLDGKAAARAAEFIKKIAQ